MREKHETTEIYYAINNDLRKNKISYDHFSGLMLEPGLMLELN